MGKLIPMEVVFQEYSTTSKTWLSALRYQLNDGPKELRNRICVFEEDTEPTLIKGKRMLDPYDLLVQGEIVEDAPYNRTYLGTIELLERMSIAPLLAPTRHKFLCLGLGLGSLPAYWYAYYYSQVRRDQFLFDCVEYNPTMVRLAKAVRGKKYPDGDFPWLVSQSSAQKWVAEKVRLHSVYSKSSAPLTYDVVALDCFHGTESGLNPELSSESFLRNLSALTRHVLVMNMNDSHLRKTGVQYEDMSTYLLGEGGFETRYLIDVPDRAEDNPVSIFTRGSPLTYHKLLEEATYRNKIKGWVERAGIHCTDPVSVLKSVKPYLTITGRSD